MAQCWQSPRHLHFYVPSGCLWAIRLVMIWACYGCQNLPAKFWLPSKHHAIPIHLPELTHEGWQSCGCHQNTMHFHYTCQNWPTYAGKVLAAIKTPCTSHMLARTDPYVLAKYKLFK